MPKTLIKSLDGSVLPIYAAGNSGPVMIVLREEDEKEEVTAHICDALAEKGFSVLSPDLSAFNKDAEAAVRSLLSVLAYARNLPGAGGSKVGAIGRGFAGKLVCLLAGRSDLEAGLAIDTSEPGSVLGELRDIRFPFLFRFAADGLDPMIHQRIGLIEKRNEALKYVRKDTGDFWVDDCDIIAFLASCFPNA